MKRHALLFALFLALFVIGTLAAVGLVLAQPSGYTDLGIQPGPNGSSLHWYSVSVPDECYGAMTTQQADGSLGTQYFKTKADYDAALATLAKPSGGKATASTETTVQAGTNPVE